MYTHKYFRRCLVVPNMLAESAAAVASHTDAMRLFLHLLGERLPTIVRLYP
jgi:hypothetical protein